MIGAIVFDFDGVLVESVEVKTRAFARLFASEPPRVVDRILEYHLKNGGVSRFVKFRTIYRDILHRPLQDGQFQALCDQYAKVVVEEVVAAPWVEGADEFLMNHQGDYRFLIVSGTPEDELKVIVRQRGMERFFDDILGSPRTKDLLLQEAMVKFGLQPSELVFVGDAETDWIAARQTGVPFIWRRAPNSHTLPGFSGPSITSLVQLDVCLSALSEQEIPLKE